MEHMPMINIINISSLQVTWHKKMDGFSNTCSLLGRLGPIFRGELAVSFREGIWVFPKIGVPPKSSILIGISINESSILGYPYFWKHLYPHFAVQSLDSTTTRWKSNSVPVTWLLLIIAEVGFGNVQRPFRVGKAGCLAVRNSVETFKNGTLCMVKLAKK